MKRYIDTEEDLIDLEGNANDYAEIRDTENLMRLNVARRHARKREVPEWATHFAHITKDSDGHSQHWFVLHQSEEIPK